MCALFAAGVATAEDKQAVLRFLERTAEHLTDPHLPRGCLFTNTILEAPTGPEPIARIVADGLGRLEGRIYDVLRRAQVERAIHLSAEKYCSASIMLAKTATITHDYEIKEA